MYVVVGLGNPGQRYAATRHNVGFMVIERLAERWHLALDRTAHAQLGSGQFGTDSILLVEPTRYMNLSGEALVEAVPTLRAEAEPASQSDHELVVIFDDLDLPCGQLRIRRGGGTGGHRGVASIAGLCGSDFVRVRVGVGRPAPGNDAAAHVLAPFEAEERATITDAITRAAEAVETLISEGLETTMNRFNQRAATIARTN